MKLIELFESEQQVLSQGEKQAAWSRLQRCKKYGSDPNDLDVEAIFGKQIEMGFGGYDIPAEAKTRTMIDISTLSPSQEDVGFKTLDYFLKYGWSNQKLPLVAYGITNNPVVIDGHHRICIQILAGRKTCLVETVGVRPNDEHTGNGDDFIFYKVT